MGILKKAAIGSVIVGLGALAISKNKKLKKTVMDGAKRVMKMNGTKKLMKTRTVKTIKKALSTSKSGR